MKIAIDARESGTSTGRYVDKLIEYMHKIGVDHEIIIMTKSHRLDFMKKIAPTFEVVAADFQEFTLSEQIGFLRFCRNLRADLIHFPIVQQPVFYRGTTVTTMNDLTTLRFKNPLTHPIAYKVKRSLYALVNKRVAKRANHIITYTQFVKDDIAQFTGVDKKKITPIHLAADKITDAATPVKNLIDKQFLLYVGRPFPHKNLRRLIDAFHKLQKDHPNLQLVLAGKKDGVYEQHLQYVKEKKIKNVSITGFVSDGELKWLYENCAAYCFPSLSEGFGLPGLEAMKHGAPVVSSNATCLPEVNGDAAHYFDPYNVEDITAKIHDVLTDEKLRKTLIKKGYNQVEKFSWEKTAKETLAVYDRVL